MPDEILKRILKQLDLLQEQIDVIRNEVEYLNSLEVDNGQKVDKGSHKASRSLEKNTENP